MYVQIYRASYTWNISQNDIGNHIQAYALVATRYDEVYCSDVQCVPPWLKECA